MEDKKLTTTKSVIFDIFLSIIFLVYMTFVCAEHAPAQTESMRYIVGAYTATCLTGVFWIAVQLFRVTLVDQLNRRRKKD